MSIFSPILSTLCELCQSPSDTTLCSGCITDLRYNSQSCASCALPLATAADYCGDCLSHPKPYERSFSAFQYQHPTDTLLHRLKKDKAWSLTPILSAPLVQQIKIRLAKDKLPEALVPVPQHWTKTWRRGFNPAALIAKHLSKQFGIPTIHPIKKHATGAQQKALNRKERLANLAGLYRGDQSIPYRRVAVVDDVVTTGATAEYMTLELKRLGAEQVQIWSLARTP